MDKAMDTVVCIGCGPSGAATNWGALIDKCCVVRMWNHDWQPAVHYGTRYDYGLVTSQDFARDASRVPTSAWMLYNVPHSAINEPTIQGRKIVDLDVGQWYGRAFALGASGKDKTLKFTRGFAAVAAAINELHPARIVIVGMDILRDGCTSSSYFDPAALSYYVKTYPGLAKAFPDWAANRMQPGLLGEGPHNYAAEAVIIRAMAAERKIELCWGFG